MRAALELLRGGSRKLRTIRCIGPDRDSALALKKYDEAIPWGRGARVGSADPPADLETAVDQAATVIDAPDKLEIESASLEAVEHRSVPETFFLGRAVGTGRQ